MLPQCQILQISGRQLYEETRILSAQTMAELDEHTRKRYHLVPYMSAEMPAALQAADLVICRSGASTLSELALLGKPSLLVPLPPTIGNSPQEANAAMFGGKQAAIVVRDIDLKPEILVARVLSVLASRASLQSMAEAARSFAAPDATSRIADEVIKIAKRGQHKLEGVVL